MPQQRPPRQASQQVPTPSPIPRPCGLKAALPPSPDRYRIEYAEVLGSVTNWVPVTRTSTIPAR